MAKAEAVPLMTEADRAHDAVPKPADVRPQVSGLITGRLFTEGSEVTKGQPLYQIDPRPYAATGGASARGTGQCAGDRRIDPV